MVKTIVEDAPIVPASQPPTDIAQPPSKMIPPTIFPGLAKKNSNPRNEPVRNVVDGWKLKSGGLVLFVKCEDGVIREITVKVQRNDVPPEISGGPKIFRRML